MRASWGVAKLGVAVNDSTPPQFMTLRDIARDAGVSLATVDRVLHNRPRVSPETAVRVREAMERHAFRPHSGAVELARGRPRRFAFVMPSGPNPFMRQILDGVAEMSGWMLARRISAEIVATNVFDPETLAVTLESLPDDIDGVAVVALDHPRVRVAIDDLVKNRKQVVTLVSDVPASQRHHYVGVDNIAAGRTAGALLGGLLGQRAGRVAVVAGSQSLRDHAERILGFRQVMCAEFPRLDVLPVAEGRDEDVCSERLTTMMLSEHKDIIGLYNVGAGTPGVAKALIDSGRAGEVVFLGHDLTELTRRLLTRGEMTAVISQNPGREAYAAVRVLLALARGEPILHDLEKIGIDIIMRDNIP